jgi:hypothetical protein
VHTFGPTILIHYDARSTKHQICVRLVEFNTGKIITKFFENTVKFKDVITYKKSQFMWATKVSSADGSLQMPASIQSIIFCIPAR